MSAVIPVLVLKNSDCTFGARRSCDGEIAVALDHRNLRHRQIGDDIDATRLQLGNLRRRFVDEAIDQLVELGRTLPIAGERFERDADLGLVVDDLERTGADRMGVEIVLTLFRDVLRRHDHPAIAGHLGRQHRIGLLEEEVDRHVVDDVDMVDIGVVVALRALLAGRPEQAVEGKLDRIGIERLVVLELHAGAEMKPQALAFVQFVPAGGEASAQLHVGAPIGEAVEDIGRNVRPGDEERIIGIPAAGIERRGNGERAGGICARRRQPCRQGGGKQQAGNSQF